MGLMVIGIHAPEFEFEREPANVKKAISKMGIDWPVVLDNKYQNWHNFSNRYWPAEYLSDSRGRVVYIHFGEGHYDQTEMAIQKELRKINPQAIFPEIPPLEKKKAGLCFIPTPEIYCGYQRGSLSNNGGYVPEEVYTYESPREVREDSIALAGKFIAAPEYVEPAEKSARLLLNFHATEVNLVLAPAGKTAKAKVLLDGKPIPAKHLGIDLLPEGQILIEEARMYNLIKNDDVVAGTLSLEATEGSFKAFAFTFAGCLK